jgi:TonB family protein
VVSILVHTLMLLTIPIAARRPEPPPEDPVDVRALVLVTVPPNEGVAAADGAPGSRADAGLPLDDVDLDGLDDGPLLDDALDDELLLDPLVDTPEADAPVDEAPVDEVPDTRPAPDDTRTPDDPPPPKDARATDVDPLDAPSPDDDRTLDPPSSATAEVAPTPTERPRDATDPPAAHEPPPTDPTWHEFVYVADATAPGAYDEGARFVAQKSVESDRMVRARQVTPIAGTAPPATEGAGGQPGTQQPELIVGATARPRGAPLDATTPERQEQAGGGGGAPDAAAADQPAPAHQLGQAAHDAAIPPSAEQAPVTATSPTTPVVSVSAAPSQPPVERQPPTHGSRGGASAAGYKAAPSGTFEASAVGDAWWRPSVVRVAPSTQRVPTPPAPTPPVALAHAATEPRVVAPVSVVPPPVDATSPELARTTADVEALTDHAPAPTPAPDPSRAVGRGRGPIESAADLRATLGLAINRDEPDQRTASAPGREAAAGAAPASPPTVPDDHLDMAELAAMRAKDTPLGRFAAEAYDLMSAAWYAIELTRAQRALMVHRSVVVEITIAPSGKVLEAKVVTESGDPALDRVALAAVPPRMPRLPDGVGRPNLRMRWTFTYDPRSSDAP